MSKCHAQSLVWEHQKRRLPLKLGMTILPWPGDTTPLRGEIELLSSRNKASVHPLVLGKGPDSRSRLVLRQAVTDELLFCQELDSSVSPRSARDRALFLRVQSPWHDNKQLVQFQVLIYRILTMNGVVAAAEPLPRACREGRVPFWRRTTAVIGRKHKRAEQILIHTMAHTTLLCLAVEAMCLLFPRDLVSESDGQD